MDISKNNDDETRCISVLIEYDEFLRKYNKFWNKFSISINKEFDSDPVYKDKYLITKTKCYESKVHFFS